MLPVDAIVRVNASLTSDVLVPCIVSTHIALVNAQTVHNNHILRSLSTLRVADVLWSLMNNGPIKSMCDEKKGFIKMRRAQWMSPSLVLRYFLLRKVHVKHESRTLLRVAMPPGA